MKAELTSAIHKLCPRCQEMVREAQAAYSRRLQKRRAKAGVCLRCGRERDGETSLCAACAADGAERSKRYYLRNRKPVGNTCCRKCGKPGHNARTCAQRVGRAKT